MLPESCSVDDARVLHGNEMTIKTDVVLTIVLIQVSAGRIAHML